MDCSAYSQLPAIVYQVLSSRLLGELYSQVLVLGIFAVFLGFLREFMQSEAHEGPIIKRALLFMGVLLFASYVALTYTLEGQASFSFDNMEHWWKCATVGDQDTVRVLLIALTPIDLLGVGLIAFLFVIVAQVKISRGPDANRSVGTGQAVLTTEVFSLSRHLPLLYVTTGLTHAIFCVWWYVRYAITGELEGIYTAYGQSAEPWADVFFHGAYMAAYITAALGSYVLYRAYRPKPTPGFFQWLGVLIYLGLTVSAYIYRTYHYFDKLWQ